MKFNFFTKYYQSILILGGLIFLYSCSGLKVIPNDSGKPEKKFSAPLSGHFNQALYKAQMDAFGRHFSGIFLIKPVPEDSSFRVVLLSEFGLNLLDLSLKNDSTEVVNCQDFLNRKIVIQTLENDLRMLLFSPEKVKKIKAFQNPETGDLVYKMKPKKGTVYFTATGAGKMKKIERRTGLWNRLSADLMWENQPFPSTIVFRSKPVKHTMKLTLLKIEE